MNLKTRIARILNERRWTRAKWPEVNNFASLYCYYLEEIHRNKGMKGETIMRLNKDGSIDIIYKERVLQK